MTSRCACHLIFLVGNRFDGGVATKMGTYDKIGRHENTKRRRFSLHRCRVRSPYRSTHSLLKFRLFLNGSEREGIAPSSTKSLSPRMVR